MRLPPTSEPGDARLLQEYREAFSDWAHQVNELKELDATDPGRPDRGEAGQRVAAAEVAYRESRDRLAAAVGASPAGVLE